MRADSFPKATVAIRVNGSLLHEHQTETSSPGNATAAHTYIESTTDAAFAVEITLEQGLPCPDSVRAKVFLDGSPVTSKVLDCKFKGPSVTRTIDKVRENVQGGSTYRRFCFAGHETIIKSCPHSVLHPWLTHLTADAKPLPSQKDSLSKIGEITVELVTCRYLSKSSKSHTSTSFKGIGQDPIPEKALKGRAISNHAQLGNTEQDKRHCVSVKADYPWGKTPIATYTFRYRPHEDLRKEWIIPRSPTPPPLEERKLEDLSPEETRELVRRLRAKEPTIVKVKNEQEIKPKKLKRSASSAFGETLDLTGDTLVITPRVAKTERLSNIEVLDFT